ncbi:NADP-dependent oxidoreductase [Microbacterium sp. CPCC 204701]|uniref:NADP-dependent oxidoreductase n=1 Tax=Microbacterium sp. CPCC 204701 TaxID=2493084 RepID=UPI0013E3A172|nr:NADP-dependent oxidoreductase [Microbacterium sp. CPCC 204701]
MKAFAVTAQGEQPAHTDVDMPEPEPGEARVRVIAASVNGFDRAVAAGWMAAYVEHRYPVVLGREFAGIVDAVGDGVTGLQVGDRVLGVVSKPFLREGAFAEFTTAAADGGLVVAPGNLSDAQAASLGHTGSTALTILASAGDVEGKTVLVVGATGGVGTLFVQLAAAAGAEIIATGRTASGRELLAQLGATHTVDYADLDAVRALAPDGVDVAVHLAGDAGEFASLVKDGGMLVSPVLPSPDLFPEQDRLTPVPIAGYPSADALAILAELAGSGSLQVIVYREHPFDRAGQALGEFGHETIGNIVIRIG